MTLSQESIDTLIDLVEIKLGCFEIYDRDDRHVLATLNACLRELNAMSQGPLPVRRARGRPSAEESRAH